MRRDLSLLLLLCAPLLAAPKGCYFGSDLVPLGYNGTDGAEAGAGGSGDSDYPTFGGATEFTAGGATNANGGVGGVAGGAEAGGASSTGSAGSEASGGAGSGGAGSGGATSGGASTSGGYPIIIVRPH
ncbi:MAG: hypothetical protein QM756_07805 [Polyangiaceae bacterium]